MAGTALSQATLSPYMKVGGIHPDLVLLLVIAWTILSGLEEGIRWAVIGGLSLDLISPTPFGIFSIALLLVAVVANTAHGRLFGSSIVLPLSLTFPLSLFYNSTLLLVLSVFRQPVGWSDAFYAVLLPVAVLDTAVMLLVFPPLYFLNRRLNPQRLSI